MVENSLAFSQDTLIRADPVTLFNHRFVCCECTHAFLIWGKLEMLCCGDVTGLSWPAEDL